MAKTKADAQAASKRPKAKGAMHDAAIAAVRARADLKKKAKDKGHSDEDDELEGNKGENSDDSSSSSESQHAEKQDTLERALDKIQDALEGTFHRGQFAVANRPTEESQRQKINGAR